MSRELYEKAEELGRLIAESNEFKAMKRAEAEGQKDAALAALVTQYAERQRALEDEISKEEKDFDRIGALTHELDDISEQMNALSAYRAMRDAREAYESLLTGIDDVLRSVADPDIQCSCKGNCAECGGCGQK